MTKSRVKLMRNAIILLATLFILTTPAAANPVAIGYFLFSGPLGAIFSFQALVTAAAGAVLLVWNRDDDDHCDS